MLKSKRIFSITIILFRTKYSPVLRPGRKRKRRRKRRDRMRKVSMTEDSSFDPSNSIKRGDVVEYTVKEETEKVSQMNAQIRCIKLLL